MKLYKYRSLATSSLDRTLDILVNNRLWFAAPSSFNDPFDCKLPVPTEFSAETWKRLIPRLFPGAAIDLSSWTPGTEPPEKLRALIELIALRMKIPKEAPFEGVLNTMAKQTVARAAAQVDGAAGVLSLSQLPDNMLLWSHYADSHSGICLEFDVEIARFPRLSRVHYSDDHPEFDEVIEVAAAHQWNAEREGLLADLAYQAITHEADRSSMFFWTGQWLYAKSADWGYELEWRAVLERSGHFEFPAPALTGVILGCAFRTGLIDVLDRALKQRGLLPTMSRARRKPGRFGVEIVEI